MKYQYYQIYKTKSGLYVRNDEESGLLVFSPYNGLIFIVHSQDISNTISWLNKEKKIGPRGEIKDALGYGWLKNFKEARYPIIHYLSYNGKWDSYKWPMKYPILINWFLTGECPLSCKYCDAEDLMRKKRPEPSIKKITKIASIILKYHPLVVVLTGGEPLISPHLEDCFKLLYGHTGIVVDTNGFFLNKEKIKLFKKYNVFVRISLDSPIPRINDYQRNLIKPCKTENSSHSRSSFENALNSISLCLDNSQPVSIQSVATNKSIHDLPAFGDILYKLGIRSWRIHLVSLYKNNKYYKDLVVPEKSHLDMRRKIKSSRNRWMGMDVQLIDEIRRNSVILISPDGEFYTESEAKKGKIHLDIKNPKQPRIENIFNSVSPVDHAYRYLSNPEV